MKIGKQRMETETKQAIEFLEGMRSHYLVQQKIEYFTSSFV